MEMTSTTPVTTKPSTDERVTQQLHSLAEEAEALLKATARAGDEKICAARERLHGEMSQLRTRLSDLESTTASRLKNAAHRSDEAVHAHPYAALGAGTVVGLLVGLLFARR
jgi:ElaB/YqjD/DUF883 family membrane-anchored ribosome-binding protein